MSIADTIAETVAKHLPEWKAAGGLPKSVSFEPRGMRDVFWCFIANEPAIITWHDDRPQCPFCGDGFEAETHPFICSIFKPRVDAVKTPAPIEGSAAAPAAEEFSQADAGSTAQSDA